MINIYYHKNDFLREREYAYWLHREREREKKGTNR